MSKVSLYFSSTGQAHSFQIGNSVTAVQIPSNAGDPRSARVWLSHLGPLPVNEPVQIGYDLWVLALDRDGTRLPAVAALL